MTGKRPSRRRLAASAHPARELDEAFDLLRSPRRRFTIDYLDRTEAAVGLDELAARVLEWEHGGEAPDRAQQATAAVYNDLYHAHVPKLASAGVAAYDQSQDELRLEGIPEPLSECLKVIRSVEGARAEE